MLEYPPGCRMCAVVAGDVAFDVSVLKAHLCGECYVRGAIIETLLVLRNQLPDRCVDSDVQPISDSEFSDGVGSALSSLQSTGISLEVVRSIVYRAYETRLDGPAGYERTEGRPTLEPPPSPPSTGSRKRWWPLAISVIVILATVIGGNELSKHHGRQFWNRRSEEVEETNEIRELGNRGVQAIRDKKWKMAVRCFSQVLELQPRTASAFCNRGFARFHLDDRDGAREDFSRASRLAPGNKRYRLLLEKLDNLNVPVGYEK